MENNKFRGSDSVVKDGVWYFKDTGKKISDTYKEHKCGNCGKQYTEEGHDGCLGTLVGLMNACCGHGNVKEAYVQFLDGECIRGEDAISILNILKKYKIKEEI